MRMCTDVCVEAFMDMLVYVCAWRGGVGAQPARPAGRSASQPASQPSQPASPASRPASQPASQPGQPASQPSQPASPASSAAAGVGPAGRRSLLCGSQRLRLACPSMRWCKAPFIPGVNHNPRLSVVG